MIAAIRNTILYLNVKTFYIGNNGAFDRIAQSCIRELKKDFPYIQLNIVLAYLPTGKQKSDLQDTLYPERLEFVPPKFAIIRRNIWMAEHSDYAIVNVHANGGAARAAEYADKIGVKIINISQFETRKYFKYKNSIDLSNIANDLNNL